MTNALLAALIALSFSLEISTAESPPERFEEIRAHARQMSDTEVGAAYKKRFSEAFAKPMQAALQECTQGTKPPYAVNAVFVISTDGITQRVVAAPDQPVSACVARKLTGLKLPAPPKADWLVSVSININP